jgi:PEP-CTERM motif
MGRLRVDHPGLTEEVFSMLKLFSSVLLCIGMCQGALAQSSFTLSLDGTALRQEDGTLCYPGSPSLPYPACMSPQPVDWKGTVSIITSSFADGVYKGTDLLSLTLISNLVGFTLDSIPGPYPGGTAPMVTLSGGEVASIDFYPGESPFKFTFNGLGASYFVENGSCHHCGLTIANGTLSPVSAVPEPTTYALMLLGLVGLAGRRTVARRLADEQR